MKHLRLLLLALAILAGRSLSAQTEYQFNKQPNGFSISSRSNNATTIVHNVSGLTLEKTDREGLQGQFITLTGIHLANVAGAPDLPSGSAFVAIPNGAKPSLRLVNAQTKIIKEVDLIPAPQPQLDNDDAKAVYEKDMNIYGKNAFYPETPYRVSEVTSVRGVEMVEVGVMPFQYNPVTKELVVYEDIELELTTEGGDGTYGDIRYRTPEWDQILTDMLLNRDVLPKVDYGERLRKHYEEKETGCQYIIITPDNDEFVQLADSIRFFRTEQGIPTQVFTVSQCGGNNEQAIRNFIRNAYNDWDMPPAAVLILGDHSTDPTKGVVSFTMNNHPGGDGYNPYISDHKYAVMGNNHMPEISIGRSTGRNYYELYHMIKKDLDDERNPPTNPNFYDKPITAMGFQLERWFQLCSEVVHGFWEHELGKHPLRVNAIYEGTPGSLWSTYDHTPSVVNYFGPSGCGYIPNNMSHLTEWTADGNMINEGINNGAFLVQHRDHGSEELWGEPRYNISYIKRLTNKDLTYVMSNNCLTGRFNYGGESGCFAEAFHRHQYGALGLIAATQVSYSFVNDVYVWGAYDNMWPDFMPTYGTQHATNFILPAFGNAAGKYFLRQSSWTDDYVKEITYYLFHQHGDAYMNLYTEMPQQLSVEMLPVLVAGSGTYSIKAEEGASICLTVGDQIIGFAQATGNLQEINVTPQIPGTKVKLTIKKQNYYRYEHELNTIPADGPYLIVNTIQIKDTEGNNNQAADYNEAFNLNVSIHNVGSVGIDNINAILTCQNPKVQITQEQATYSHLDPDEILTVNEAFAIQLGENFEDGEKIRFHLQLSNDEKSFLDSVTICVNAPLLQFSAISFASLNGEVTDRLMKGESTLMTFDIQNTGHSKSMDINNTLSIKAPFLNITEESLTVDGIDPGTTSQVTFRIDVQEDAPEANILDYQIEALSGTHITDSEGRIFLGYTLEDFEDDSLNPLLKWRLGSGSKAWYVAEDATADGGHCLHSPATNNNDLSTLYIGINCDTPGKVSFWHKTSTEHNDYLKLYINSVELASWSGESDWEQSEFALNSGSSILKFVFQKNAQGSAGEDCVLLDNLRFPPFAHLIIYAGNDGESCPNEPYVPSSYVSNQSSIQWSSDGDGFFEDPSMEQPVYHFGDNDIANGLVTLTLSATSEADETTQSEYLTINILEDLAEITPETPVGESKVDLRIVDESNYTIYREGNDNCIWTLEPETAGSIQAEDKHVTIIWNKDFRGIATLKVKLSNDCGESDYSEALTIDVYNSTMIDESQLSSITVYPNPANDFIRIKSSEISQGQVIIRIIDNQGKVVFNTKEGVNGNFFETSVDVSEFKSGLYDIQIVSDNSVVNTRVIIL